eukprot:Pgem_evm1s12389
MYFLFSAFALLLYNTITTAAAFNITTGNPQVDSVVPASSSRIEPVDWAENYYINVSLHKNVNLYYFKIILGKLKLIIKVLNVSVVLFEGQNKPLYCSNVNRM